MPLELDDGDLVNNTWRYAVFYRNVGGLEPISRDTDNNAAMSNCWQL